MKRLLIFLLLCGTAFGANDFSGDPDLYGLYTFENDAFGIYGDSSGYEQDLTNNETVANTSIFKEGARSIAYDTNTDYVYVADADLTDGHPLKGTSSSPAFSAFMWCRITTNASLALFFKGSPPGNDSMFDIRTDTSRNVQARIGISSGTATETVATTSSAITLNQWYWVCVTWDDSTKTGRLYVWDDTGSSVFYDDTNTLSNNMNMESSDLVIGNNLVGGTAAWRGYVDEVGIIGRVLTTDDMTAIINGTYAYAGGNGSGLEHGFSF